MDPGDPQRAGQETDQQKQNWSRLMAKAQDGDREAFLRLLQEIVPYLRKLARRQLQTVEDVEDAVQDTLLTIHAIRQSYDPRRPFGPWLVAIASRRIIDRARRRTVLLAREVAIEPEHETFSVADANFHERAWERRRLRKAVESLPLAQRQAITLLRLRELSLKEAALESGRSVAALKVAAHRALKALRGILIPR
jgi:RNA polymerase sigma-70 factor (ECF subfamily)